MEMDIKNKILCSKDLFELADNLEQFITYANNVTNKKREYAKLHEELIMRINAFSFSMPNTPYAIFNEQMSVLIYLANYWDIQKTSKQNVEMLSQIIEGIRTKMLPPKEGTLSEKTMVTLLDYVDKRFSFYDKVLKDRPLKILRLNHSHSEWNCFYTASIYLSGAIDDCVMMTYMSNDTIKICRQEFGFLHELGHKLHTQLTKKLFVPPASFSCFEDLYNDSDKSNDAVMAEHFADVFAIAALSNSPYADCIPFEVTTENANLFTLYILITIMTMDENIVHSKAELYDIIHKLKTETLTDI